MSIMEPFLFFYREHDGLHELSLSDYSTAQGLGYFDKSEKLQIIEFGATGYKHHGWVNEKDIPVMESVGELVAFLEENEDIGLIHFEASVGKKGRLASHDDGECHFSFFERKNVAEVLKTAAPAIFRDKIIAAVFENPGKYVAINEKGEFSLHYSFDDYLQNLNL